MSSVSRNSNIELLRLVLIFMVVLLHFNNDVMGGAFCLVKDNALNNFTLHFFESISVCAVNCFMIVSGYFLFTNKRVDFGKVVDILLIVVFYRVFDYFMQVLFFSESFSLKNFCIRFLPVNYFAIYYVVCYVLSPFIAQVWDKLEDRTADFLIALLLMIFILIPTGLDAMADLHIFPSISKSLSPISMMGNGEGYTIVQFLMMLSLGMWLRKRQLKFSSWVLIGAYLVSSLIMTVFIEKLPSLYNYCSIFTVVTAVCIFLLFSKLDFQKKSINYCAKSCFAIFCIHTSGFALNIWQNYFITESHLKAGILSTVLWTLISVGSMFLCCLVLSLVMRLLFGKLKSFFCGLFPEYVANWK